MLHMARKILYLLTYLLKSLSSGSPYEVIGLIAIVVRIVVVKLTMGDRNGETSVFSTACGKSHGIDYCGQEVNRYLACEDFLGVSSKEKEQQMLKNVFQFEV